MKNLKHLLCAAVCACAAQSAWAQPTNPTPDAYSLATYWEDVKTTRWETAAVFAGATALGIYTWDWGSSKRFKTNPEGWFGKDTGSGGADKLGHAFISYAITNVLTDRLERQNLPVGRAALSAALTTQALMLYVEVFDGYSNDHGFAREDMVMNLLGSGLAYARAVTPGLRDKLDFRMEYQKSGYKGFRPISDYEGQKYVLALKLGGFNNLRQTPLRYVELQTGYYSRGFASEARFEGLERTRHSFVGVGLNLNQLLLGQRLANEGELRNAGRLFFEHIQVPHTSAWGNRTH
jgi:hypothetical protein